MSEENTKQVLIWRNDLKVRKGKIASQISHASMSFLTKNLNISQTINSNGDLVFITGLTLSDEIDHWLKNSFRKICVYVNSEEELVALHQKALDSGLISYIIEDNGATEFNGVKTITALAIGPHFDSKFIGITDHLPLL
jgi:PTH2 family peptidyl-tRNA hydrolase